MNLNKKQPDQRLSKESTSTNVGLSSRMKLQKVNVTCKLNSPFKGQPKIEVCKSLSHNAFGNLKFTASVGKNPTILNTTSAIHYVNTNNNYVKKLLDDHQTQKVTT